MSAPGLHSRLPIVRMVHIRRLLMRGDLFTASSVAVELKTNPKTITRDIAFMREHLNYEITYSPKHHSFYGRPSALTTL